MATATPLVRWLAAALLVVTAAGCDGEQVAAPPPATATPTATAPASASASATTRPVPAATPPEPAPTPTTPTPTTTTTVAIEERVDALLARMTLAEKIGQMTLVDRTAITPAETTAWNIGAVLSGGDGAPVVNDPGSWRETVAAYREAALATRLAIPTMYGVDAVHGAGLIRGATVFPHNIGLGAANDPELVEEIGRVTATEMSATGMRWDFAPVVAVPGDLRWGRTYEAYSEDVAIVSDLAAAAVRGLQETDDGPPLSSITDVLATPKHFIGDGGTTFGTSTNPDYLIDQGDTRGDEATLLARHLPPYEAAIAAGARTIMVSFSSWNGTKMHANGHLLTDVLKAELGFDGFLVSDWAGIDQIPGDYPSDIVTAVNAGVDMVMVPFEYEAFIGGLTAAVRSGQVTEARIDDAVRRILRVKFEMGLFELPFPDPSALATIGSAEHRALARRAVHESAVLLKNAARTLPLDAATPLVLVAGAGADDVGLQSGGWTIDGQGTPGAITPGTTIADGVRAIVAPGTRVEVDPAGELAGLTDGAGQPVVADVAIVVLAEPPYAEGPGDRVELSLPAEDLALLARVRPRAERLVVVLLSGRPLVVTDQVAGWDALVAAWLPGTEGDGIADLLFGTAPFTGRLPYTWPRSNDQLGMAPTVPAPTGCDGPLFPLGYGLATDDPSPPPRCPTDGT